jgi:hypothetical protein
VEQVHVVAAVVTRLSDLAVVLRDRLLRWNGSDGDSSIAFG